MNPNTPFWREMQRYVDHWSLRYPSDDEAIAPFAGRKALLLEEIHVVLDWKLESTLNWLQVAKANLARDPECFVVDSVARAISCNDDSGSMRLVCEINGIQLATGSALLMATNPDRFTVYDERALASLKSACVDLYREPVCMGEWLTFLNTCRRISRETDRPLRTVDRALWAANGSCNPISPRSSGPTA